MNVFQGKTTSDTWEQVYTHLFSGVNSSIQNSRLGKILEIMKVSISIENSRDRWTVNRKPMISPAFAIAEVFWILDGSNEADFINTWNPLLKKYAGDNRNYYGAYGERLKYNLGFDQIQRAYETLKKNPNSRQVVLQIWDGKKDLPYNDGNPNSEDIPCNTISLLKVRDNKLEWSQIMRSNDLFRGTPYNFIQFTTLQEIMAGWLKVDIGEYFHFTDSLHVYKSDIKIFSKREKNLPINNSDKLLFSKSEFDKFFPQCIGILKKVQKYGVENKDILNLKSNKSIPQEYKNLLSLPLAYLALKSNNLELVQACETICTNKLLLTVWELWKKETYKS